MKRGEGFSYFGGGWRGGEREEEGAGGGGRVGGVDTVVGLVILPHHLGLCRHPSVEDASSH